MPSQRGATVPSLCLLNIFIAPQNSSGATSPFPFSHPLSPGRPPPRPVFLSVCGSGRFSDGNPACGGLCVFPRYRHPSGAPKQSHVSSPHSRPFPNSSHRSRVCPAAEGHSVFHLTACDERPRGPRIPSRYSAVWGKDVAWIRNAWDEGSCGRRGGSVPVNRAMARPGSGIWGRRGTSHERWCLQGTFLKRCQ